MPDLMSYVFTKDIFRPSTFLLSTTFERKESGLYPTSIPVSLGAGNAFDLAASHFLLFPPLSLSCTATLYISDSLNGDSIYTLSLECRPAGAPV